MEYLKLEKKYSQHTLTAYKNDLTDFVDYCVTEYNQEEIHHIHYSQIRNWIVSLVNRNLSNRSINRKVASLKSYYKFLQKIGEIDVNPLKKHKALKTTKKIQIPFSKEEVSSVLGVIDQSDFTSIRNKLIVELFYSTGIRRIELINLRVNDVDLYNKTIKVLGKRNKERFVPLLPSVINTINQYLELKKEIPTHEETLFLTKKGNKIYETLVYRVINSYFSQVSTKVKKSPHILRHSFATHLLNQGANLNSVKELLGHSSLASTQVYTHNSLDEIKKVFNQSHPRSEPKKITYMKIRTQSVNFNADKDLLTFIEKKLEGLEKFHDKIIDIEVFLKVQNTSDKENKITEVKINVPGQELIVKRTTKSFEEGICLGADSLKRQLKKSKEKHRDSLVS